MVLLIHTAAELLNRSLNILHMAGLTIVKFNYSCLRDSPPQKNIASIFSLHFLYWRKLLVIGVLGCEIKLVLPWTCGRESQQTPGLEIHQRSQLPLLLQSVRVPSRQRPARPTGWKCVAARPWANGQPKFLVWIAIFVMANWLLPFFWLFEHEKKMPSSLHWKRKIQQTVG